MATARRLRDVGGTPIEEAPFWVLAIFFVLLALVFFPAVTGLAESFGHDTRAHRPKLALAGGLLALLIVTVTATRRRWRRARTQLDPDHRPWPVRLSTWLWASVLYPNVLLGVLALTREERVDPRAAWAIGLLVAAIQGLWAWRRRRR